MLAVLRVSAETNIKNLNIPVSRRIRFCSSRSSIRCTRYVDMGLSKAGALYNSFQNRIFRSLTHETMNGKSKKHAPCLPRFFTFT